MVEIKPAVGDDYPAVLRQMKAQAERNDKLSLHRQVLLLERYTGTGATREQFVKTFEASGKFVVFRGEIPG